MVGLWRAEFAEFARLDEMRGGMEMVMSLICGRRCRGGIHEGGFVENLRLSSRGKESKKIGEGVIRSNPGSCHATRGGS
jgi:hypothetical protein